MGHILTADAFMPFNFFEGRYPIKVDLVYAQPDHPDNHFPGLYHPEARLLWAHRDFVPIVLLAALICHKRFGWSLKLNDFLRTVEGQVKMLGHGYDPSLVSRPGEGGHCRALAGDVEPIDRNGKLVNMGTRYDQFAEDLFDNPAARDFAGFALAHQEIFAIRARRTALDTAMYIAASKFNQRILGLPQEWWDYRFERGDENRRPGVTYWGDYEPVYEADLPAYMHLVEKPAPLEAMRPYDFWKPQIEAIDQLVWSQAKAMGLKKSTKVFSR